MRKVIALWVLALAVPLLFAGAEYSGDFSNVELSDEATIRVHQWLDISSLNTVNNEFDIYDYDQEYEHLPPVDYVASFIVYNTNAALSVVVLVDLDPEPQDGQFTIKVRFYEWQPNPGTWFPADDFVDPGTEVTIEDHADSDLGQSLGIGFKISANEDVPADTYTLNYQIVFNPTVTFAQSQ